MDEESSAVNESTFTRHRATRLIFLAWIALAAMSAVAAAGHFRSPGLYYDEAVFGGLAKDFLTGQVHGSHMPGTRTIALGERPFPLFVQDYLGALKVWMAMPGLKIFGFDTSGLRLTNFLWAQVALLFFMLGIGRWLGTGVGILTGVLLAFDPNWFFLSTWDWGAAVPSFLCRALAIFFAAQWWHSRRGWHIFLSAFFCGLGFFNKVDFAVLLVAASLARILVFRRESLAILRTNPSAAAWKIAGLFLGAGLMLFQIKHVLMGALSVTGARTNDFSEKLHALLLMFDGSYFYRLLSAGGVFERMYAVDWRGGPLLAIVFLVALIILSIIPSTRKLGFFLVATTFLFIGALLFVPGATRLHHWILLYPIPHLAIATIGVVAWQSSRNERFRGTVILVAVVSFQGWTIWKTEKLVDQTGGRGRWSEELDGFLKEAGKRSDAKIVSLDWGFNEQVLFLTNSPQASELFWNFSQRPPELPFGAEYIYLVHAPEYSLMHYDTGYLELARKGAPAINVREFKDREGRPAFYAISFPSSN